MRNINSWPMVILKLTSGILKLEHKGLCAYIHVLINILGILKKGCGDIWMDKENENKFWTVSIILKLIVTS